MKIFNKAIIYTICYVLNRASVYILLPIYLRQLNTFEFGIYELINNLYEFFIPIGLLGLDAAALRFFSNNSINNIKVHKAISKYSKISVFLYLLFAFGLFLLVREANLSIYFILIFVFRMITAGYERIVKSKYRIQDKYKRYLSIEVINFIVLLASSLTLLFFWNNKLYAVILSISLQSLIGAIYWFIESKKLSKKNNSENDLNILNYALPISVNKIVFWIYDLSDRLMIKYILNVSILGIYGAVFKLGALSQVFTLGFSLLWPSELLKIKDHPKKIEVFLYKWLKILSLGLLFINIFLLIIKDYLLPSEYSSYTYISPLIISSFYFKGIDYITSSGLFIKKKSLISLKITIFSALINIIINLIFLKKFGIIVVAVSTLISTFINTFVRWRISRKYLLINLNSRSLIIIISFLCINIALSLLLRFI